MRLVKPMPQETVKTARDGLTMAAGPRSGHAAPGLTFAQGFRPEAPVPAMAAALRLVAQNGQRVDL